MLKNIEALFLNYIFSLYYFSLLLEINLHLYEVTWESPTCSFSSQSFFSLHFGLDNFYSSALHFPDFLKMIFLQAVNFHLVIFFKHQITYFSVFEFPSGSFSVFHSLLKFPFHNSNIQGTYLSDFFSGLLITTSPCRESVSCDLILKSVKLCSSKQSDY